MFLLALHVIKKCISDKTIHLFSFNCIFFFYVSLVSNVETGLVSLKSYELSLFPINIKIISLSGMLTTSKLLAVIAPQLLRPVQLGQQL